MVGILNGKVFSAWWRFNIAQHQKCYLKAANINVTTYRFKNSVKDNQITRQKLQVSIFFNQKVLHVAQHGRALSLMPNS
jgi:hypothetical protein